MPELTEQEKLERRREKRKQRILASAENRLSRITGTAFPRSDRRSPSPSPAVFMAASTSTETLRSRKRLSSVDHSASATAATSATDPNDAAGAPQLPFLATTPPAPILEASVSSSSSSSFMHHHYPPTSGSPLPMSLEALLSGGSSSSNNNNGSNSAEQQSLPNLNDLFGGQLPFNPAFLASLQQQQQQENLPEQENTEKYWDLLHFVSMLWLGIYAVYTEWCTGGKERFASLLFSDHSDFPAVRFPLFWYFVTVELLLQSGRMVYQKGNTASSSLILAAIMQYLPPQIGNVLNVLMRYWIILSCLVKDIFVLVFIIGLAEIVSAVMV
ncbi:hypothetical protein BX666DRAFT_2026819 [Dichotomocladium elegans]|nr:hypothetical protein BX666DRAFT_2026819 [Dichotomocladium elegans]